MGNEEHLLARTALLAGEIMLVNSRDLCINYSYRALYIQVQVSARQ